MGRDFLEASSAARELCDRASAVSQVDIRKLILEGSAEELAATDRSQLAITFVSLAAAGLLAERGIQVEGCAGFSLGEYAALCEAGVLSVDEVFPLVKARGELMERASRQLDTEGEKPGMSAVLGLPPERVQEILSRLADDGVFLANRNSPVQVVLSGTASGLSRAEEILKKEGARRIVRLKVSGPFHSPLMEQARKAFAEVAARVRFSDPRLPVYSNASGERVRTAAEARTLCVRQLVSPVRWVDQERRLLGDGFDRFLEVGPGNVLAGLLRALAPQANCAPAGKLTEIDTLAVRSPAGGAVRSPALGKGGSQCC